MDSLDTIFSLHGDVPEQTEEAEAQDRTSLQPGSVARGSLKDICFVRKITPAGAVLCMESDVRRGEEIDLALLTGELMSGTVEWTEGREIGLRFHEAADIFALISRNLVRQAGDKRRMPRIEVDIRASLQAGPRHEVVRVGNVSGGGACIETRTPLTAHEQVVLTLDGFRPATAIVRWVRGNVAGLAFGPEISWQELMPWLKQHHRPQLFSTKGSAPPAPASSVDAQPAGKAVTGLNLAARVREGSRRWTIDVESIDSRQIRFHSYAAVDTGRLFWVSLPGLEGWPARVVEVDGYLVTCQFMQPLHPAVLERVLAAGR